MNGGSVNPAPVPGVAQVLTLLSMPLAHTMKSARRGPAVPEQSAALAHSDSRIGKSAAPIPRRWRSARRENFSLLLGMIGPPSWVGRAKVDQPEIYMSDGEHV